MTETSDDGEGDFLAKLRRQHLNLPIAAALDMHANISDVMVRNCDVIVGYGTYPQIDVRRTGERAGRLLIPQMLDGGSRRGRRASARRPMLPHAMEVIREALRLSAPKFTLRARGDWV